MKALALVAAACAAVTVALVSATAWAGSSPTVNVKPYVYLSVDDVSATEGATAAMTIHVWPTVSVPVQVKWWTENHTAIAPADYAVQSGTATIPAGKSSVVCNVSSQQDAIHETAEHFHVYISSSQVFVKYTKDEADFTIVDDDPVPTVHIADAPTITEGGELAYPVTLSNPTVDQVTVTVDPAAAGTSPTWNSSDYTSSSGTVVTFDPLATSAYYTFSTVDDAVYEGQEHAWLRLTGAMKAVLPTDYVGWSDQTDAWANGIVNDNESPPVVAISDANPLHVTEGGDLVFTLTLSRPSQQPVDVTVNPYGAGSSLTAADYRVAPATSVHFPPLATAATYKLFTSDDYLYEGQQHAWLHLAGVTGGFLPGTDWIGQYDPTDAWAIGFADDNESVPVVSVHDAATPSPCGWLSFPVTLSGPSETYVGVSLTLWQTSYYQSWDQYGYHQWQSSGEIHTGTGFNPGQTSSSVGWSAYCSYLHHANVEAHVTGADGAVLGTYVAHGYIPGWSQN